MRYPAVILAGGKGARMGGKEKGLLRLGGQTLIERAMTRLSPDCGPLAVNANGDTARYAAFGLSVLPDTVVGQPGPLAGVLAAMDWAVDQGAEAVLTVPADTPFFPRDLASRLMRAGGLALAASQAPQEPAHLHPVFGVWPVYLRDDLRSALAEGQRKVRLWADRHNPQIVLFTQDGPDPFFNINTPEDYRQAKAMARGDQCFRMK